MRIARDSDGELNLHKIKPFRRILMGGSYWSSYPFSPEKPTPDLEEKYKFLKWEDESIEI